MTSKSEAMSEFMNNFADKLAQMETLVSENRKSNKQADPDNKAAPDETTSEIAKVILKYQPRFNNPKWSDGFQELLEAAKVAEPVFEPLLEALGKLNINAFKEIEKRTLLSLSLNQPIPKSFPRHDATGAATLMAEIKNLWARTILYDDVLPPLIKVFKEREERETTSRNKSPTAKYVEPADHLMTLWHHLTGEKATEQTKNKAEKPSTEFVRLGLLMMDYLLTPMESLTKTRSAIRGALKI